MGVPENPNFIVRKRATPEDYWYLIKLGAIAATPITCAILLKFLGLI